MYMNIPSEFPLTLSQAWLEAKYRFNANTSSAREDLKGICYQGNHGETIYREWNTLPPADDEVSAA